MLRTKLRLAATMAIALAIIPCAGCVERVVDGDTVTYQRPLWITLSLVAGSLACVPIGWLITGPAKPWSNRRQYGHIVTKLVPIIPLGILAPAAYTDRVMLDSNHFETVGGSMASPIFYSYRFQDLESLQERVDVERSRRNKRVDYELLYFFKSGNVEIMPVGRLTRIATDDILDRARKRGVAVSRTGAKE